MLRDKIGSLPVVEGGRLQIMTRDPITITPASPVEYAARLMVSARIGALPVVQDTRLIGIVTETDLLRILSDVMPKIEPTGASIASATAADSPRGK